MTLYDQFLQALEGNFEEFVKSDVINTYLQTIGPAVTTEVLHEGIFHEFTVVSGYEAERGTWATVYDNVIRFGEEIHLVERLFIKDQRDGEEDWYDEEEFQETFVPVDKFERPMVITPAFFYGRNQDRDELSYRMGLIKGEDRVHLKPVVVLWANEEYQCHVLEDLCVIHAGLFIDPETAQELGQEKLAKLTSYQQFLSCLWNIDDYLRKLNPAFRSDFDTEVWEAVETFSGRIVNEMLYEIQYIGDSKWQIPQLEDLYLQNLVSRVDYCMKSLDHVAENQVIIHLKNLCSFVNRFFKHVPLGELVKRDPRILDYLLKITTDATDREIYRMMKRTLWPILKTNPGAFQKNIGLIPPLLDLIECNDDPLNNPLYRENPGWINGILTLYLELIGVHPELITANAVHKIQDLITWLPRQGSFGGTSWGSKAVDIYRKMIETTPDFLDERGARAILKLIRDSFGAQIAYRTLIETKPQFIEREGIDRLFKILLMRVEECVRTQESRRRRGEDGKLRNLDLYELFFLCDVYETALKSVPQHCVQVIPKIIGLLSDPNSVRKKTGLKLYNLILTTRPKEVQQEGIDKIVALLSDNDAEVQKFARSVHTRALRTTPEFFKRQSC